MAHVRLARFHRQSHLLNCAGLLPSRETAPLPVWNLLAGIDAINAAKKPALVFGSFGWTGEAVGNIQTRLMGLKMNVFEDGFKVTFVPSEEDLENAKEFGKSFALSF